MLATWRIEMAPPLNSVRHIKIEGCMCVFHWRIQNIWAGSEECMQPLAGSIEQINLLPLQKSLKKSEETDPSCL